MDLQKVIVSPRAENEINLHFNDMLSPKLVDDIQHPLDISEEQKNNQLSYNEESMLTYSNHVPSSEI